MFDTWSLIQVICTTQRLAEIAHTLLKVSPYDPLSMGCRGLSRYMNEILPYPDWSREDLKPALINILRRLDKMFNKIAKSASIRVTEIIDRFTWPLQWENLKSIKYSRILSKLFVQSIGISIEMCNKYFHIYI